MRRKFFPIGLAFLSLMATTSANARPVVLELFTSQGCSSCPPADALLSSMQGDAGVLPLSLHVDYWDRLGWKDPMSASAMTQRQYAYAAAMGGRDIFTPQLVVDGYISAVGSNETAVKDAIAKARTQQLAVELTITTLPSKQLLVQSSANADSALPATAEVEAFYYTKRAVTEVSRGENGGRRLSSIHNVTRIETLAPWQAGKAYRAEIAPTVSADEGVAVIIQRAGQGAVIGAISAL